MKKKKKEEEEESLRDLWNHFKYTNIHIIGVPEGEEREERTSGDTTGTPGILSRHTVKGSLVSSYEGEKGLLWMWAGLSCFLSSGDGYVGELLELQQGCEGPFGSSRGYV